jgi:hypothetical protein
MEHGLEGEGGLADAWLAAKKDDAARNETTAEDAVQFLVVHVDARVILVGNVAEAEGFAD